MAAGNLWEGQHARNAQVEGAMESGDCRELCFLFSFSGLSVDMAGCECREGQGHHPREARNAGGGDGALGSRNRH